MTEFTLNGGIEENDGMWRAEIMLKTPDGKQTILDSGFVFTSKQEAEVELQANMDRILRQFSKDGVEVVGRNGVKYQ